MNATSRNIFLIGAAVVCTACTSSHVPYSAEELEFNRRLNALEQQAKIVPLRELTALKWRTACYLLPYTRSLADEVKVHPDLAAIELPDDIQSHLNTEGSALLLVDSAQSPVYLRLSNSRMVNDPSWIQRSPEILSQVRSPAALSQMCVAGEDLSIQTIPHDKATHVILYKASPAAGVTDGAKP